MYQSWREVRRGRLLHHKAKHCHHLKVAIAKVQGCATGRARFTIGAPSRVRSVDVPPLPLRSLPANCPAQKTPVMIHGYVPQMIVVPSMRDGYGGCMGGNGWSVLEFSAAVA